MPTSGARGQAAETLAGFIYNIKEEEAADINNGGLESQVEYLLAQGWLAEDLRRELREES